MLRLVFRSRRLLVCAPGALGRERVERVVVVLTIAACGGVNAWSLAGNWQ